MKIASNVENVDWYRLGRYLNGDLNSWIEIIGDVEQSLKKRLSAVAGLAGILHSKQQSEKSKRDAFHIMMELIDKQSQLDTVFTSTALEYLAEFLLLNSDGGGHGIDTTDVMPSSYHYLDEHLVLPHLFDFLTLDGEKELVSRVLTVIDLPIRFPPVDMFKIFIPLLEAHSSDETVTNQLLSYLTNQMVFNDEILKFFISYIGMNIQRATHQKFVVQHLPIILERFIPMADSIQDAKLVLIFLLKRFPVKVVTDEYFWALMKYELLHELLAITCTMMGSVDFACDMYYDVWSEIGKGLVRLDSMKPRGFEEFHSSGTSFNAQTLMLTKLAFISSVKTVNFKILHHDLLPIIVEHIEDGDLWPVIFTFIKKVNMTRELATDWIPDVLFLLNDRHDNVPLINLLEYIFTFAQNARKELTSGAMLSNATDELLTFHITRPVLEATSETQLYQLSLAALEKNPKLTWYKQFIQHSTKLSKSSAKNTQIILNASF